MTKIAVLTYNQKHRKTFDTLCLLKAKGYHSIKVFAQPMKYEKKTYPLVNHRPELIVNIPEPDVLCKNMGYTYIEGRFCETIPESDNDTLFLLCGAGILSMDFVSRHRIINSHPGYIPLERGLDAYKWSIYYDIPFGVTTHFLGEYIDGGEIIGRREIDIYPFDTFHSVAQRIYENEIDMLISTVEYENDKHEFIVPKNEVFKRMPSEIEKTLYERFEKRKCKIFAESGMDR